MTLERSPRVVMVSASFHPYVGGAEKQALELSAALRRLGVDVRVLTRRLPGLPAREEIRGTPVRRLWCFGTGLLNAASFMASLCGALWREEDSYDVIHVHLAGSPAVAAAAVGRWLGKKVIVKLGGTQNGMGELAFSARSPSGRLKLWALACLKPQFAAVTGELAAEAKAVLGPVPVALLPNGVDTERYRPVSEEQKKALRHKFGWPAARIFLYVGRLSREKRLAWFLEVWAALAHEAAGNTMILIGAGPEEAELKETVLRCGAQDRVEFLGPREDIEAAYAAADVFVLPSVSEGLSNALLEAMASGLAVLASRVGGTAEAVSEGRSGLLFESGERVGLEKQLRRMLVETDLAARLGREARQTALERYSLSGVAKMYVALYRQA